MKKTIEIHKINDTTYVRFLSPKQIKRLKKGQSTSVMVKKLTVILRARNTQEEKIDKNIRNLEVQLKKLKSMKKLHSILKMNLKKEI